MSLLIGAFGATRHVGSVSGARANSHAGAVLKPATLSILKLVVLLVQIPLSYAAPLIPRTILNARVHEAPAEKDASLWAYLGVAAALVLLGGAFAGLTIALMGQDEIYLQVIASSGEGSERKNATKVLNLLNKGKHWVLVTLLLSNVITNETLPIVLDRSLGGGWPAVLGSTVLIVIFGEIAPQSVCVRYGLPIGAWMAPAVLGLMWIMAPVAWPTAKLLDWLLGEDHGQTYKKAGLKTLVTLHKTLGQAPGERLNEDEVTIISAVLDLKDKPVGAIMTPMNDVFTMSADTVLDEKMMDLILSQGYSRIPIYEPENPRNFIGMLLVKILITYDPEDCQRVRDFALATLPETAPDTSCLDIVNFFQEGKSHMVLVSDFPGKDRGALGVLTLEDVIEELIGEEIIDESDVFVDVHRAIRRGAPAPRMRYNKGNVVEEETNGDDEGDETDVPDEQRPLLKKSESVSGKESRRSSMLDGRETTFLMRRRSSGGSASANLKPKPVRSNTQAMRPHLKHLGPSNVASRPKSTKYTAIKIKPGVGTIPEGGVPAQDDMSTASAREVSGDFANTTSAPDGGVGAGLLQNAGTDAKDGAQAVSQGYGTIKSDPIRVASESKLEEEIGADGSKSPDRTMTAAEASAFANQNTEPNAHQQQVPSSPKDQKENRPPPEKMVVDMSSSGRGSQGHTRSNSSESTLGELNEVSRKPSKSRQGVRSGSITEQLVDVGGLKKMVLETTSSSDTEEAKGSPGEGADDHDDSHADDAHNGDQNGAGKKKKKKKRAGKKTRSKAVKANGDENEES